MSHETPILEHGGWREPRYAVSLPAKARIRLGHEGSTALNAKATIENVSRNGVCALIHKIKGTHVPLFAKKCQRCLLICRLPDAKDPLFLEGEIVWMEFCGSHLQPEARIGLRLTETAPGERERLEHFIEGLVTGV